jgi:predicted Zn-dependent protease
MSKRTQEQSELASNPCFSPSLYAAIQNWQKARFAFQDKPGKGNQDYYCKCTDELGQCIGFWARSEQPELAVQFGLWFKSHDDEWTI